MSESGELLAVPTDEPLRGETHEGSAQLLQALTSFYGIESIDEGVNAFPGGTGA